MNWSVAKISRVETQPALGLVREVRIYAIYTRDGSELMDLIWQPAA